MLGRPPTPLPIRFWRFVSKENSCWLWTGKLNPDGYGLIRPNPTKEKVGAHRISWTLHNGPIPTGLCVLHKCDKPSCVNPDHLFLGTVQDNVDDMRIKGRANYTGRPRKR